MQAESIISPGSAFDVEAAVRHLHEEGYVVLPSLYPTEVTDYCRKRVMDLYDGIGRPPARTEHLQTPEPGIEIGPAGIVFRSITSRCPDLAPLLLRPEAVAVIRGLLGDDMYLELPAGVVSDHTRPFFDWHVHIGGVDDSTFRKGRIFPSFERSERVTMLHYMDDLAPDTGPLSVLPRKITDPTPPPFPVTQEHWEGEVDLHVPRGSVVIIEQCTWHAARQMQRSGLRLYIGCYFAAKHADVTPLLDPSLYDYSGEDELYRSVLPVRPTS